MLEYISGDLVELSPAQAIIETQGLGFAVNISLTTYTALQGQAKVKLYVYEAIREDAFVLYGFASKAERNMFLLLISVSGVGASTARMILSSLSTQELCQALQTENVSLIKSVKGIGLKTAQRIIVDLKDKMASLEQGAVATSPSAAPVANELQNEAVAALVMLGFASNAAQKVVTKILADDPTLAVEQLIKRSLKFL